eukprot:1154187-Pelagomonas_calceolata.AAC.1
MINGDCMTDAERNYLDSSALLLLPLLLVLPLHVLNSILGSLPNEGHRHSRGDQSKTNLQIEGGVIPISRTKRPWT